MFFPLTVIGAHGRMGAMFREAWGAFGSVFGVDRKPDAGGNPVLDARDIAETVPRSGTVLLCVPAPVLPEVMDVLGPYLREDQLLADACSVKIEPMRHMEARFSGPVVGTHPLFGPENERRGARAVLVPGRNATEAHTEFLAGLFRRMGCAPFVATAGEHDRNVALSQSLHFALAAAYFAEAARQENLAPYCTPSFLRYMDAARNELTGNAAMFREFTEANPLFPEVLEGFRQRLANAASGGLAALVTEAQAWYARYGEGKDG